MNTKVMSSDDVRIGWRDVVDDVISGGTVLVEQSNKPVVAVISYEDFMALREQLEDLHDLRLAEAAYAEYKRDPSGARSIEDLVAEWDARDAAEETAGE